MLKKEELRIGNLVAFKHAPKGITTEHPITQLEEITLRLAGFEDGDQKYWRDFRYESVDGIPLSTEWLERCGVKDGALTAAWHTHIAIRPYETAMQGVFPGKWRVDLLGPVPHLLGRQLEFVHELQNLVFALTCAELEIKQP